MPQEGRASSAHLPSEGSDRVCPSAACAFESRTARATSCPRADCAARCTCSSPLAAELDPPLERPFSSPYLLSRQSTGRARGSHKPSTGFLFFRSTFHVLVRQTKVCRFSSDALLAKPLSRTDRQTEVCRSL